jgi:hypothetical protein
LSPAPTRITNVGIVPQFGQREAEALPHFERHRVALVGIVEGDDADAIADALQDLAVGVGCFGAFGDVEHWLRLSVGKPGPLSDKLHAEVNR